MEIKYLILMFIHLIEITSLMLISTHGIEHKDNFIKKEIFYTIIKILLLVICYVLTLTVFKTKDSSYILLLYSIITLIIIPLESSRVLKINLKTVYFCCTSMALTYFLINVLYSLISITFVLVEIELNIYFEIIIQLILFFLSSFILYMLFTKTKSGKQDQFAVKLNVAFYYTLVTILSVIEYMVIYISFTYEAYQLLLCLIQFFFILMMFFIFYSLMKQEQSDIELMIIKKLWKDDKKHLEIQKESVDIINIKCHDLRHQIQDYRQQDKVTDKMMKQLEQSIHIYDAFVDTNNETLNVILSSFSLRCQNNDTELTCMCDGKKIEFIDEIDMYSLFTNILDNALEYEVSIPKEKRFISLTIREVNQYVKVHCENSYIGNDKGNNLDLSTNKKDKINHGFGLKSIKNMAEKYEGKLDIFIEDDMFQIVILFPSRRNA